MQTRSFSCFFVGYLAHCLQIGDVFRSVGYMVTYQSFLQYFSKDMPSFKPQTFAHLLTQAQRLHNQIEPFLIEISNFNIQWIFGIIQEISKTLKNANEPVRKINALVALLKCMQKGNYCFMLLSQIYLVPSLNKVIDFLLQNRDFQAITTFFQKNGYLITIPHIQNLSYNYVTLTYKIFQTASAIKPFRTYQGQQYEQLSLFKKSLDKLTNQRINLSLTPNPNPKNEFQPLRRQYLSSLSKFGQHEDQLIYFFMDMLQKYLIADNSETNLLFHEILHYGQSNITGQTIARLIDIVAYHSNFDIRIRGLRLFDRMILWGDVEALLVINFTENIESIIKALWRVRGQFAIEEGRHIYPEVEQQQHKKLQFYKLFLICLQNWAISFPNHEFIVLDPAYNNQPSPIYQLYKLLRQKKKTIFPSNTNLVKYETDARLAFLEKLYRNTLILRDMSSQGKQKESHSSYIKQQCYSLKQIYQYYEYHKEMLISLISKKISIHQCMEQFIQFQLHFEQQIESLIVDESDEQELDKLIENGLQLIQVISLIRQPYQQLLHSNLTEKECHERVINICINFFSPSQGKFIQFYSQKIMHRKEILIELLKKQRSTPLQKDLHNINNSIVVKQFRQNYKQKLQRVSSSKASEQSQLNLEIFTRNKFTRESRDQMEKTLLQKKQSSKYQTPTKPQVELLRVKNNVITTTPNSLAGSRQKKKLTLASRQLFQSKRSSEKVVQNENTLVVESAKKTKNENSSQTRSSRQNQTQKPQKIINTQISYYHNSHYFSYIPNQSYKFSYIHTHILIFRSPFLTIERVVHLQDQERVRIEFVVVPHREISQLEYYIEDQECIKIEKTSLPLPVHLQPNVKYSVEIYGEMKKVPLRMPIIAFFISKKIIFEYILPFTINFFFRYSPNPKDSAHHFNRAQLQSKYRYYSQKLILSKLLFPQSTLTSLPTYLPGSFALLQPPSQKQRFLWQVHLGKLAFLLIFELQPQSRVLQIRGYDVSRSDNYNQSMIKYTINFLAHLFAQRLA